MKSFLFQQKQVAFFLHKFKLWLLAELIYFVEHDVEHELPDRGERLRFASVLNVLVREKASEDLPQIIRDRPDLELESQRFLRYRFQGFQIRLKLGRVGVPFFNLLFPIEIPHIELVI